MLKNWTRFQKLTVLFLSVSLLISIGIIVVLLVVLQVMERRLNTVGNVMEEMAVQHIITEVTVDESIPLKSDISVMDELVVNIDMTVNTEIPFTAKIPVSEEMLIPFKIGVRDYIKLDTTIQVTDWVNIDVNDTIPLNQKVKMPIFGERGPSVPIQGKIPVQQQLRVGFSELLPVHSVVPVDMLIIDTLLLPIGKDNSVYMKRSEINDKNYFQISTLGKRRVSTMAYQFELKNNNPFPIQFELVDQVPISQTKSAEVEINKTSNGQVNNETGEIYWNFGLKPGQDIEKELIFTIEMDADYRYYKGKATAKYRTISCPSF